jgi:hypothetical protein
MRSMFFGLLVACAALLASESRAAVVVDYNFAGEPGNQVSTAGTTTLEVTPIAFTRGSGLTATSAANSISSSGWDTLAATDYFSFGFTVNPGFFANLESISLSTRSSNTGPGFLSVYSSLDGFTDALFSFTQTGTGTTTAQYDVSSLAGLTGPVEFRILSDNTTSANGGTIGSAGTFRVNSASIQGQVTAVPEPASVLALSLISGGAVLMRRFRKGDTLTAT